MNNVQFIHEGEILRREKNKKKGKHDHAFRVRPAQRKKANRYRS